MPHNFLSEVAVSAATSLGPLVQTYVDASEHGNFIVKSLQPVKPPTRTSSTLATCPIDEQAAATKLKELPAAGSSTHANLERRTANDAAMTIPGKTDRTWPTQFRPRASKQDASEAVQSLSKGSVDRHHTTG